MTPDVHPANSGKELAVEGLRGLAALNVFLSHFLFGFFPRLFDALYPSIQTSVAEKSSLLTFFSSPLFTVFFNGGNAVAVFFVLSGYVLTKPYFERGDVASLRSRFVKRYFRLMIPSGVATLLGYGLYRGGFLHNVDLHAVTHSDWLTTQFRAEASGGFAIQDALMGCLFHGVNRYDPPLWTMRVEFVGSLLLFAAYALFPKRSKVLPNTALVLLFVFGFFSRVDALYFAGFWLGSLLPHTRVPDRKIVLPISFSLGMILLAYDASPFYSVLLYTEEHRVACNLLGAAFLLYAVIHGRKLNRFFCRRPFVFLGKISFSMYLIHIPILFSFTYWTYLRFLGTISTPILLGIEAIATSLVVVLCSLVFERLVDRSGIRFSSYLAKKVF